MALRLGDIVAALGGELQGDPELAVDGLATLESAGPHHLSFLSNPRYQPQLQTTRAGCASTTDATYTS